MPPREATNPFPDQYLTLDYEGGPLPMMQHDLGGGGGGAAAAAAATGIAQTQTTDPTAMADEDDAAGDANNNATGAVTAPELQEEAAAAGQQPPAQPLHDQQTVDDEEPSDPLGNEAFLSHGAAATAPVGGSMMMTDPLFVQQLPQQAAYAAYPSPLQGHPALSFGLGGPAAAGSISIPAVPSNGGAVGHHAGRPRAAVRNVSADPLSVDTAAVGGGGAAPWTAMAAAAMATPARAGSISGGASFAAAQVSPHFSTIGVGGPSSSAVPVATQPQAFFAGRPGFGGIPPSSPNFGGAANIGADHPTPGAGHSRVAMMAQPRRHGAHGADGSVHSGQPTTTAAAMNGAASPQSQQQQQRGALPTPPSGNNNNMPTHHAANANGNGSTSNSNSSSHSNPSFAFPSSPSMVASNLNGNATSTPPRAVSLTSVTGGSGTVPPEDGSEPTKPNAEARVKACSALSNLAIGYDNKIPMFNYPGFVECILGVIETDADEARTKACSILWSFAAEMKNQVPVVQRGDILPTLVEVADEDDTTEARFKCVAALTLLAESLANAIPLLESGALAPLMDILHDQSASLDDDDDEEDDGDVDNDQGHSNGNGKSSTGMSGDLSVPGLDTTTVSDSTEEDTSMAIDHDHDAEEEEQPHQPQQWAVQGNSTAAAAALPATSTPPSSAQAVVTPQGPTARLSRRSRQGQQQQQQQVQPQPQSQAQAHVQTVQPQAQPQPQPSPYSNLMVTPLTQQQAAAAAMVHQMHHPHPFGQYGAVQYPHQQQVPMPPPPPPVASPIGGVFGPLPESTTVANLKYYAEQGLIPHVLAALTTPKLKVTGTRLLADYAKQADRRKAVAGNRLILDFVARTMVESPQIVRGQVGPDGSIQDVEEQLGETGPSWLAREYAVETIRSLTATEESDVHLMGCPGLLQTLACVARGGPFVSVTSVDENAAMAGQKVAPEVRAVGMASPKARLHACIAIMNLSCGKSNKVEIASVPDVLEAMRDVMMAKNFPPPSAERGRAANVPKEARLKATTCIKNLSNADANDAALLDTPGLVEALGIVAEASCSETNGATMCTTNACLALMNLSISKANKHRVFRTPGVMDALMAVVNRTVPPEDGSEPTKPNAEARVKACSALSNLAIGYDNKIPMFNYPGFVECILGVIETDADEARTKACSILWSFAAEMKNQVPVVQRGDILPTLVEVADEDDTTEARFKCVAALTLLAESLANAIPLLESGALAPLMDILHEAGPDPTQWKGQTASWCVGFLMNIAQSDEAVPGLREAGVVELLAPLLTLDHYQSLKAAMAITFVCRYDEGDETYDLLRKTENVIPKITQLLHNTLSGKGGNGYKYGVFTLRSSVGCISALASGPDFMKERIATKPVFESLLQVLSDFCVDGGTPGAIVGGGRDDILSATLAVRALQSLTAHLIPIAGSSSLPQEFVQAGMEQRLVKAFQSFETCSNAEIKAETRHLASDARSRIVGNKAAVDAGMKHISIEDVEDDNGSAVGSIAASIASSVCGGIPHMSVECWPSATGQNATVVEPSQQGLEITEMDDSSAASSLDGQSAVRTFLLADERTGRRFAVPSDPTGGRAFNDNRVWCYRRGRFCKQGEEPDPNFQWTDELQAAYMAALAQQEHIR